MNASPISWNQEPLVSIIVPIYNVAPYLECCIRSLIEQDYTHLEIILINDGSTDDSGLIAERFCQEDSRLILVNQPNAGLSAARNAGLERAAGEYIIFVDSDDWIHRRYVSVMYEAAIRTNVPLVMCDRKCVSSNSMYGDFSSSLSEEELIPMKQALSRMLHGEWWSAWAKFYHKDLFSSVRFPVGRNNEDYAILPRILEQAPDCLYLHQDLYCYRMREGSICHSPLNARSFDEIENDLDVMAEIRARHPEFYDVASANLAYSLEKLFRALCFQPEGNFREQRIYVKQLYEIYGQSFLKNKIISAKSKSFVLVHVFCPFFAQFFFKFHLWLKRSGKTSDNRCLNNAPESSTDVR